MKDSEIGLADLLANDSFLRWVKNKADRQEQKEWQEWLEEEGRGKIVKRAKKLVSMPFRENKQDGMEFEELRNLRQKLKKRNSNV